MASVAGDRKKIESGGREDRGGHGGQSIPALPLLISAKLCEQTLSQQLITQYWSIRSLSECAHICITHLLAWLF